MPGNPQVKQREHFLLSVALEQKYYGQRCTGKGKVKGEQTNEKLCLDKLLFKCSYSLQDLTFKGMLKMAKLVLQFIWMHISVLDFTSISEMWRNLSHICWPHHFIGSGTTLKQLLFKRKYWELFNLKTK